MLEVMASRSELATSRKSFPVDFSLTDENGQPHLRIDDGQEPHLLVLRVTNRSGRDMQLMADAQGLRGSASAAFHHFRITFRPGVLSARTREVLASPRAALLLGADAALWDLAFGGEQADGSASLVLVFTGASDNLAAGDSLSVRLQGVAAGGASARPTRVQFNLGQVRYRGEEGPIPGAPRHGHLYLLHGGRRDLPLHFGFRGNATIRADQRPDRLELVLTNRSPDDAFGAWQGDAPAHFMISFDHPKVGYWGLFYGIGDDSRRVPPTIKATGPAGKPLDVEHLGRNQEDNPLRWKLQLPQDGIPPGNHAVHVFIDEIIAGCEGPINLYLDSYNIPGYANTRTTLVVTRSLVTPDILREKLEAADGRMAAAEDRLGALEALGADLAAQARRLGDLSAQVATNSDAIKQLAPVEGRVAKLSEDWRTLNDKDKPEGLPKLWRDVDRLKQEAHFSAPIVFPAGCAYRPLAGTSPPPYYTMVWADAAPRLKWGGWVEVPSLRAAMGVPMVGMEVPLARVRPASDQHSFQFAILWRKPADGSLNFQNQAMIAVRFRLDVATLPDRGKRTNSVRLYLVGLDGPQQMPKDDGPYVLILNDWNLSSYH